MPKRTAFHFTIEAEGSALTASKHLVRARVASMLRSAASGLTKGSDRVERITNDGEVQLMVYIDWEAVEIQVP